MTNTTATDPVWQYESEALPLSEAHHFQLILWKYGLSYAGFTSAGIPVIAATFLFETEWDVLRVKAILIDEPVFAGPQPIKTIWMAEERQMLIPAPFFKDNFADTWLRTFHFIEPSESLIHRPLAPALDAFAIFPVKEALLELIREYLPEAKIRPLSLTAFSGEKQASLPARIRLINLPKLVLWSFVTNNQFQHHQISPAEEPENVLYTLGLYLQDNQHAQQAVAIDIEGIAPFWKNLHRSVGDYFPQFRPEEDTTVTSLEFYKKLFTCAS